MYIHGQVESWIIYFGSNQDSNLVKSALQNYLSVVTISFNVILKSFINTCTYVVILDLFTIN
jgi:hypothetical protein